MEAILIMKISKLLTSNRTKFRPMSDKTLNQDSNKGYNSEFNSRYIKESNKRLYVGHSIQLMKFISLTALSFALIILPLIFTGCNSSNTPSANESLQNSNTTTGVENGLENNSNETIPANNLSGKLEIIGSTSTQNLVETIADKFIEINPEVKINYQGVGSSKGIKAVKDGTGDIGTSSRELKEEEKEWGLNKYVIAQDGIALVVNPKNQIKELTIEQIIKIFKGEITSWKDLGGSDKKIIVLSREAGSGTRGAFEELIKIEDQVTKEALIYDGNGPIKAAVASTEDAIGYISFGYIDDSIKTVKVDGIKPTIENVLSGSYPLSRPFIIVTKGNAEGLGKEFIDYILNKEGQNIVKNEGYIPVKGNLPAR
jgi:phosphate transport system substrate-binding protein